jgi:hypothetical protein
LNTQLSEQKARNEESIAEIMKQRAEIEAIVTRLENAIQDLEGANQVLGDVELGDLDMDIDNDDDIGFA